MAGFIPVGGFQENWQPFLYYAGTDDEAFTLGEVVKMSSGVLTKADADTDGTQEYIVMAAKTGDGSTRDIPVVKIRKQDQYRAVSNATVAATVIGSAVTIHTDGATPTATTTKGIFVIDETDGAADTSSVVGHFNVTGAV